MTDETVDVVGLDDNDLAGEILDARLSDAASVLADDIGEVSAPLVDEADVGNVSDLPVDIEDIPVAEDDIGEASAPLVGEDGLFVVINSDAGKTQSLFINGKEHMLACGAPLKVPPRVLDALRNSSLRFEEVK